MECDRPPEPRLAASEVTSDARSDRHAGTDPKRTAVASETSTTNVMSLRSVPTAMGAREPSDDTRRRSASLPNHASATPNAAPADESTRLSVINCRSSRGRLIPSARRKSISCRRDAARASRRFATFAQLMRRTRMTAARSSWSGCANRPRSLDTPCPARVSLTVDSSMSRRTSTAGLGPKMLSSTRRNVTVSLASA